MTVRTLPSFNKLVISVHDYDWCHLCGERTEPLLDIFYPENAEHHPRTIDGKYIRICKDCIEGLNAMIALAKKKKNGDWA